MPYKIFRHGKGEEVRNSKFFKISFIQSVNDSVYFTTEDKVPLYFPFSETIMPYDLSEIWPIARKGDSIVSVQLMDTFIRRMPERVSQFKKDDRIISYVKILDVFDSDSLQELDLGKEKEKLNVRQVVFIENYLADRKIKAQKTPGGAFVEIIQPGSGNLIDSGNYVSFKYKGYTFQGNVFDSNMDSTFGHPDPLSFVVGTEGMIKGFNECALLLRKGAVARFYIPSLLAYGPQPNSDKIQPYENIIFYIEVLNVSDKAPQPTN